jgi:hypothetical protein
MDFGGGPGTYLTGFCNAGVTTLVMVEPHPLGTCLFARYGNACTPSSNERSQAAMLSAPLLMVLISRLEESLREAALMTEERGRGAVTARCREMDLSDLDAVADEFQLVLEPSSHAARYDSCLLVNNAGSLGPVGLASSILSSGKSNNMKESFHRIVWRTPSSLSSSTR